MSTGDARSSAFDGQSRQQRHPEDESVNGLLIDSSSGAFLLPNAQGGFTFSAEPGMIDYPMASLSSTGTAQDTVFTPNTGSSFDSSLHPEYMIQSYPPPNYLQPNQTYMFSPGIHSRTGHSISPSHSIDHLSPEAAYLSDPSIQDISNYTSPNVAGHYTEEVYTNGNHPESANIIQANAVPNVSQMSFPMTADTLALYNAQTHHPPPPSHIRPGFPQLISPSPTNNSSPLIPQEPSAPLQSVGLAYPTPEQQVSGTPPAHVAPTTQSTPRKQQHSPALTHNSGGNRLASPQPIHLHLTSPIVRIEHYTRGESPARSDTSRPVSKRSHGSRRSANHLSPYPIDESSDDEEPQRGRGGRQSVIRSAERADDGTWIADATSGQAGLSPGDRQAMADVLVPTLEEMENLRIHEEKKLEVHEWLSKSEVGSEAGDVGPSSNLLKPFASRRRAKSTNDAHRQDLGDGFGLGVRTDFGKVDDSGIPGPGLYLNEPSEHGFDDDDGDEDNEDIPESPVADPAEVVSRTGDMDKPYFLVTTEPASLLGAIVRPWADAPNHPLPSSNSNRYQPPTSNAAMMRFRLRAKDMETASLAATLGSRRSRRLSESDIGSIRHAPGIAKAIEDGSKKPKERQRRPSFINTIRRTPSNILKRKNSIPVPQPTAESVIDKAKDTGLMEKPRRIGSWGRPKSPRIDTSFTSNGKDLGPPSASNLSATSGPWYQGAKNAIKRTRSKSDLGKSFGLAELMTQHGGPPMPMLASPLGDTEATRPSPLASPGPEEDEDEAEHVTMDLAVRSDPIIPTYEGFKTHARQLNPRLVDYMVERITHEQMRRYKRLLEFKVKHLNAVKNRNCASGAGKFCRDLGGSSNQLPPRAGNKDSEAPFIGFQVTAPGSSDEDGEAPPEGTIISAQFPSGVPLPPVKRLPAEFECPLCFKVKKFYKPSDWTKHVHEDVQPFTCTFPSCGEPKSFKRKADWVRHENERHRQLEYWTCTLTECNHTCYRKDNFVQHLVREHKIAEPKGRSARVNKDASSDPDTDIMSLVESCHRVTTKQPKEEPCRFCGNICTTWKKLTVHLAKHMEQISMPILPLVEQKNMSADTVISPVIEQPESHKLSRTPSKSPIDRSFGNKMSTTSTFAPGISPSFGNIPQHLSSSAVASNAMRTYPPTQFATYKTQQPVQTPMNNNAMGPTLGTSQTYPSLLEGARPHTPYANGQGMVNHSRGNSNAQNDMNGFTTLAIMSTVGQQPAGLTSSPVETTFSSGDGTMGPAYFTQEPQAMADMNGGMPDVGFSCGGTVQYNPSTYPGMLYSNSGGQQHYQYPG